MLDEKSLENILIYDISYKTLISSRPLRIRLDKVNRFIRVSDKSRYLILFRSKSYDAIYDQIRYFFSQKSDITCVFSHNYAKIKIDSHASLSLEKKFDCALCYNFH